MNVESIASELEAHASAEVARATSKQVRTIRGVRGTPLVDVARLTAQIWRSDRPELPRDEDELAALFGGAWEDGLVAIGLLAALVPDAPPEALDIGFDWLERLDELHTADALGWLVLGPAVLASGADLGALLGRVRGHRHAAVRRAAVMMGMAMTPTRIEGPSAAALRERLGTREVHFVESSVEHLLEQLGDAFLRDEDPSVRKALRRVLASWAADDPTGALAWMNAQKGGVPKMIREELERAARKGARRAAEEQP